jgi:NAD+ diphosphatase
MQFIASITSTCTPGPESRPALWFAFREDRLLVEPAGESARPPAAPDFSALGLLNYPRLSPAVIVAVERGNRILLARARRFTAAMYSVIAGFVEPGETLEECVRREVMEETGIRIRAIRYFGSQPWPFPDSLMIGFTAEYESGELLIDGTELVDAGWFAAGELPTIPGPISIARRLIDAFAARHAAARSPAE